jgi:hypothetical protein
MRLSTDVSAGTYQIYDQSPSASRTPKNYAHALATEHQGVLRCVRDDFKDHSLCSSRRLAPVVTLSRTPEASQVREVFFHL